MVTHTKKVLEPKEYPKNHKKIEIGLGENDASHLQYKNTRFGEGAHTK